MSHVTDEELGLLLTGRLERAVFQRVLRQLSGGRSTRRALIGRFGPALLTARKPLRDIDENRYYDAAIERSVKKALAEAPGRQREQRQLGQVLSAIRNRRASVEEALETLKDLDTQSLVEALIALSYDARFREPKEMLELAFASVVAASHVDTLHCTPGILADLQGAAWACLGNAYRVNERYDRADKAFVNARALLAEGTGDPLGLARLIDLQASLRTAQRRLPEAINLLDLVIQVYDSIGENHLAGRALISKGINLHYGGSPQEAVKLLRQGSRMLEPTREPELASIAQKALLHALVDCGEVLVARRLLLDSGLRQAVSDQPLILLRLRWIEGKIHAGLGKLWRAEAIFQEVREAFGRHGLEYDAALVGLELMDTWLRQDRTSEVRKMAAEVLKNFEVMKVEREALRAVRFLEEACRREQASAALVQRVVQFLQRLEWEPRLQFAT